MPTSFPVSALKSYETVLEKVEPGSPVYLTRNGHSAYSIRSMEDEEKLLKADAMVRLMCEINVGIRSGEEQEWVSEADVRDHIHNKRRQND